MDRLKLWTDWPRSVRPHVDHHSLRVFVSAYDRGVFIARLIGERLIRERTLTCVKPAHHVDVMSLDTIYVSDYDSHSVRVVDVKDDKITSTLETPDTVRDELPVSLAVLGDSIIVGYAYPGTKLVAYSHGSPTPVRVIPNPWGMQNVNSISTDCHSHYIVTDNINKSVLVIDVSGNLRHKVNFDTESEMRDCIVVNRQIWLGCDNGEIVIMSSE